jgi:threonine dehydratase
MTLTVADIEAARRLLAGIARVTPVYGSETFSRLSGREVLLKAENLQRTGSFKIRGAATRMAALGAEQRRAGVVAASAGNHGQAVAWAARQAGVPATIFVPEDAPMAKVEAARAYGARVEMVGESFEEAVRAACDLARARGAVFVHAFEDERVIAGQGTIGLELAEQVPALGTVLIPIGGGGLAAGVSLALRARRPRARIVGVEVDRRRPSIADGIQVKARGRLAGAILGQTLDEVVQVTDEEIAQAVLLLLERAKLVVEGAGAVGLAALLAGKVQAPGPLVAILSGGNIDAATLLAVMRHGLALAGRYLVVRTRVPDRPGELFKLLQLVARERVNVVEVEHRREGRGIPLADTEIWLTLATRDEEQAAGLVATMEAAGYAVERLR